MGAALTAAASVAVGVVIGVLSGLLGIGGGTMMVPVLKLGYHMAPIACTATSLFVIVLTSVSGTVTHVRNRTCIPRLGIAAGLGGACLSPVGVWLATLSPDWLIMAMAALVIAYSAITMLRKALALPPARRKVAQPADAPSGDAQAAPAAAAPAVPGAPAIGPRQLAVGFAVGLAAGLASGYVGVGGGFLMVPLLMSLVKTPMRLTSGTSLLAVLILAIPSVAVQASLGNVDWLAGIAIAVGTVPGAVLGSRLIERVPERSLRLLFAAVLAVAAVLLVADQL